MAKVGAEQRHDIFPEYVLVFQLKTGGVNLTEVHTNESSANRSISLHKEYYNISKYKYNGQDFARVTT